MDKKEIENLLENVKREIKNYPDFPKKGILFWDIFPVLGNPSVFDDLITLMLDRITSQTSNVDAIAGIESRGFLFGPLLAHKLKIPFVPVRKVGKLPGPTQKITYDLEYGSDTLEVQKCCVPPNSNVVIVDDLLATGGTMKASCELIEKLEAKVALVLVVIELADLNGRSKLDANVVSLIKI